LLTMKCSVGIEDSRQTVADTAGLDLGGESPGPGDRRLEITVCALIPMPE
jgi:hypothetical protein